MLNPRPTDYCSIGLRDNPRLVVVIDTEEEFDWSREFSRHNTAVQSMRSVDRLQRVFDGYSITPVYVVDYPVASNPCGYRPLEEIVKSGRCVIGAHLHPWVNPPFEEQVNNFNSFSGNLPRSLEAEKLRILTDKLTERFGLRPIIYKAGRYGIGPNTSEILEEQGYEVDLSICPRMDYSPEGGPNFINHSALPFWFGNNRRMLEIPLTVDFIGLFRRWGTTLSLLASRRPLAYLHLVGVLSRAGLLNKVWASPEGYSLAENIALCRALFRQGLRVFSFAFHSPSMVPGNTPYVTSEKDLERFLAQCRQFFDFFLGELGGISSTPIKLKADFSAPTA